ncbi:MAG TPA: hypothetical protein VL128_05420 [Candidatus Eisenbacteria bacterium]|nr:hypothetical protein [Candidatus Eisenbacteria bacterium]
MGISAIVHIADRLLQRNTSDTEQNTAKENSAQAPRESGSNRTEFGDTFTASEQANAGNSAGEAGFVQTEQLRFAVRNFQAAAAGATVPATNIPGVAQPPATAGATASAVNPQTAPTATIGAPTTNVQPAAAAAPSTQTQEDLQTLNSDLSALGLNAAEIAAFDQFASVLFQFDPNALQELENELNLLATQFQEQAGAATGAAQPASTNSPGFQLNELSIVFRGFTAATNPQGSNTAAPSPAQLAGFTLQVQAVSVTLGNAAGHTAQIQVPSAASNRTKATTTNNPNPIASPTSQTATA